MLVRIGALVRALCALAAFGFLVDSFTEQMIKTKTDVDQLANDRLSRWAAFEDSLHRAGTGLEPTPRYILDAVDLLRANDIQRFQISRGLTDDQYAYQRISEIAWPIKVDNAASVVVRSASERSTCTNFAAQGEAALDRCD